MCDPAAAGPCPLPEKRTPPSAAIYFNFCSLFVLLGTTISNGFLGIAVHEELVPTGTELPRQSRKGALGRCSGRTSSKWTKQEAPQPLSFTWYTPSAARKPTTCPFPKGVITAESSGSSRFASGGAYGTYAGCLPSKAEPLDFARLVAASAALLMSSRMRSRDELSLKQHDRKSCLAWCMTVSKLLGEKRPSSVADVAACM